MHPRVLIHSGLWMVVTLAWMLLCRTVIYENEAIPEQAAAEDRKGKRRMTDEQQAAEELESDLVALEHELQALAGGQLPDDIARRMAVEQYIRNAMALDEQRESLPVRAPSPPPDAQCSHVSGQALIECHTRSATAAQCVGRVLIGGYLVFWVGFL